MAVDEALLTGPDRRPALRLYAWSPAALSLGWFQPGEAFDAEAARAAGAVLVRRLTGGGAIHHDRELTFALVATPGEDGYPADTIEAYRLVHAGLAAALEAVGARVTPRGEGWPLSTPSTRRSASWSARRSGASAGACCTTAASRWRCRR